MEIDCFLCAHGFGAGCDSKNTLNIVSVTEKGVEGLKSASEKRGDGLHDKFSTVTDLKVHDVCRKNYTRPTSIKKYISKNVGSEVSSEPSTSYRTRSTEVEGFDIKTHCLFCAKHIDFQAIKKRALKYRNSAHHVETLTVQTRILNIACIRGDDWGREVDTRVRAASDLVAAEAIYHGNCLTQFFKLKKNTKSDDNDYKHDAFLKLCNRLNENVFDGYEGPATTKNQEQDRRACRIQSRTIHFDLNMTASVTQAEFLGNAANKSRLISELKSHFDRAGFSVLQAVADADFLIASTALQQCSKGMKTAVVGTDTDLLALLVHGVKSSDTLFFIKPEGSKGSYKVYPVAEISSNLGNMKDCILFAHAFSGCDTTSATFRKGKKVPWKVLEKSAELQKMSNIFKDPTAEPDMLTSCGEQYFLAIYGDTKCKTLNELRYFMFNKLISRQKITSSFDLSVLPPTSDAARLHTFRVYYQVQKWLGKDLDPCSWGWLEKDGVLVPQSMTLPPAPDKLLNFITCDCKKECARSCDCIRSGLACSAMCAHCQGRDCNNTLQTIDLEEEDVDSN